MRNSWSGNLSVRAANALMHGLTSSRYGKDPLICHDDLRKMTEAESREFIGELVRTNQLRLLFTKNIGKISAREILLWLGMEDSKPKSIIQISKDLEKGNEIAARHTVDGLIVQERIQKFVADWQNDPPGLLKLVQEIYLDGVKQGLLLSGYPVKDVKEIEKEEK